MDRENVCERKRELWAGKAFRSTTKMLQVTEGSLQQLLIIVIFLYKFERIMTNKGNEPHAELKNDFTAHATNCEQIKTFF